MTPAELDALASRVEAAEGADRGLDGLIFMATLPKSQRLPMEWAVLEDTGQIYAWSSAPPHASGTGGVWASSPEFTASLNASLPLASRGAYSITIGDGIADGLPGCCICVAIDPVVEVWGVSRAGGSLVERLARATAAAGLRAAAARVGEVG